MSNEEETDKNKELCTDENDATSDETSKNDETSQGEETSTTANACYKYDDTGMMTYTDPTSKVEYVLDPSGTNWIPRSESESKYSFDGKTYLYTDEKTGIKHRWDLESHTWIKIADDDKDSSTDK